MLNREESDKLIARLGESGCTIPVRRTKDLHKSIDDARNGATDMKKRVDDRVEGKIGFFARIFGLLTLGFFGIQTTS